MERRFPRPFAPALLAAGFVAGLAAPAALAQPRRVVFGCDSAYAPYEYVDAKGRPAGFNVDLLEALARETGLSIEIRSGDFWKVREEFESGRIDALAGWGYTEERAARYRFATPHAIFTWSIFGRTDGPRAASEADLAGRSILAQKGDLVVDDLASKNQRLVPVATPEEALRGLAAGRADLAVLNTGVGLWTLNQGGIRGVARVGPPFHPVRYCIVLHRGDEELLARVNEGLFVLRESGAYKEIFDRHLGAVEPAPPFRAVLRRALVVLVPVLVLLVAALAWSWTLRRLVRRRTLSLERELAERRKVEASLRLTRFTIDHSADSVYWVREDGTILDVNEAASRTLGYSREELLALRVADLDPDYPEEDWLRNWKELRTLGSATFPSRHRRKDGSTLEVEVSANLVRYQGLEVNCAIVRDVTERRAAEEQIRRLNAELEERVRVRTAQLEASNRELEAFSYSVSHDLRAPLRAIEGFSALVLRGHAGGLDAEGLRLLGIVRTNAVRMSKLIDDLLAFSRTGRSELRRTRLDMRALARAAFADVEAGSTIPPALEFRLGEIPGSEGDAAMVRQVFFNLVSNAVKFSRRQEKPVVEVGATVAEGEVVYFVRDNGTGFDMARAGKLFGVFQRLHSANEYEGTGVGLALVKRIVERHGGRVFAEGEPGRGASFHFTLRPANLPAPSSPGEPLG